MSLDVHSTSPDEPAGYEDFWLYAIWGEHIVAVVATSIAVLIVAVIAVLMGMA